MHNHDYSIKRSRLNISTITSYTPNSSRVHYCTTTQTHPTARDSLKFDSYKTRTRWARNFSIELIDKFAKFPIQRADRMRCLSAHGTARTVVVFDVVCANRGGRARDDKLGSLSSRCVIYLLRDCLSMVLVERGWLLVEMWNQMLTLAKVGSGSTNHQLYIYIYPLPLLWGCVCVWLIISLDLYNT